MTTMEQILVTGIAALFALVVFAFKKCERDKDNLWEHVIYLERSSCARAAACREFDRKTGAPPVPKPVLARLAKRQREDNDP